MELYCGFGLMFGCFNEIELISLIVDSLDVVFYIWFSYDVNNMILESISIIKYYENVVVKSGKVVVCVVMS